MPIVMENKDYVEGTNRPQLLLSFYDSKSKRKYLDKQVDNSHMNMMRKVAQTNREMTNLKESHADRLKDIYLELIDFQDSIDVTNFPDSFDASNVPYECFLEEIGFQVSTIKNNLCNVIDDVYLLMKEIRDEL